MLSSHNLCHLWNAAVEKTLTGFLCLHAASTNISTPPQKAWITLSMKKTKKLETDLLRERWIYYKQKNTRFSLSRRKIIVIWNKIYKYDTHKVTQTLFSAVLGFSTPSCVQCFVNEPTFLLIKCNITFLSAAKTVNRREAGMCCFLGGGGGDFEVRALKQNFKGILCIFPKLAAWATVWALLVRPLLVRIHYLAVVKL